MTYLIAGQTNVVGGKSPRMGEDRENSDGGRVSLESLIEHRFPVSGTSDEV